MSRVRECIATPIFYLYQPFHSTCHYMLAHVLLLSHLSWCCFLALFCGGCRGPSNICEATHHCLSSQTCVQALTSQKVVLVVCVWVTFTMGVIPPHPATLWHLLPISCCLCWARPLSCWWSSVKIPCLVTEPSQGQILQSLCFQPVCTLN